MEKLLLAYGEREIPATACPRVQQAKRKLDPWPL